jgi:16S rRNA (cytosine1402-N4)-methyltransferase
MAHIPVLLNEVMEILKPQKGEFFIDGTFGAGGHSEKILEAIGENGKVLAIDWDEKAKDRNAELLEKKNIIFVEGNYAKLKEILQERNLPKVDGLLLDLGFSSDQLKGSEKGFSFSASAGEEPLIMSYGNSELTAYEVVNSYPKEALQEIIKNLGEERFASRIAEAIIESRRRNQIKTNLQLAEIIRRAVPKNYEHGRIDPATRTFQALRIYVNGELENLKTILGDLESIVKIGGRVAVISFHSLEDRIVKNIFRDLKNNKKVELLNKKPITASREEIFKNPRSRSAKLRGIIIK